MHKDAMETNLVITIPAPSFIKRIAYLNLSSHSQRAAAHFAYAVCGVWTVFY